MGIRYAMEGREGGRVDLAKTFFFHWIGNSRERVLLSSLMDGISTHNTRTIFAMVLVLPGTTHVRKSF